MDDSTRPDRLHEMQTHPRTPTYGQRNSPAFARDFEEKLVVGRYGLEQNIEPEMLRNRGIVRAPSRPRASPAVSPLKSELDDAYFGEVERHLR